MNMVFFQLISLLLAVNIIGEEVSYIWFFNMPSYKNTDNKIMPQQGEMAKPESGYDVGNEKIEEMKETKDKGNEGNENVKDKVGQMKDDAKNKFGEIKEDVKDQSLAEEKEFEGVKPPGPNDRVVDSDIADSVIALSQMGRNAQDAVINKVTDVKDRVVGVFGGEKKVVEKDSMDNAKENKNDEIKGEIILNEQKAEGKPEKSNKYMEENKNNLGDKAEDAKEAVEEKASGWKESISNLFGGAKDNLEEKKDDLKEKAEDTVENVKDKAGELKENAKETVENKTDDLKGKTKDNIQELKEKTD